MGLRPHPHHPRHERLPVRGLAPLASGWRDGAPADVGARYGGQSRGLWDLMQDHPLAIPVGLLLGAARLGGESGWLLFVV